MRRVVLILIAATACKSVTVDMSELACNEDGKCLLGYECDTATNLCVPIDARNDGGSGDPIAGDPIAGDPIPGDPIPGDPIPGDPIPGDPIAGDPLAGDPVAGDPATGCTSTTTLPCNSTFGPGTATCQGNSTWGSCEPDYGYRVRITIDASGIGGALTNVPILVRLNDSNVSDYDEIGAGGIDLLFLDDDGTTELSFEIEEWDAGGDSWVWVGVPRIETGTADFIWMYFGDSDATDGQNPAGVWDADHVGVWHLAEDAGGTGNAALYADSTGNHPGNDQVASSDKTGLAGPGQLFEDSDRVVIGDHADLTPAALTLEMSIRTQPLTWAFKTTINLSHATPENDFQIALPLSATNFNYASAHANGDDLRFFDAAGNSLPYWIERWVVDGDSLIWVKATESGTDTIIMWHGNAGAAAESDAATTLESGGLWTTFWDHGVGAPNNVAEMDNLFASLTYASRKGWAARDEIDCYDGCDAYGGDDEYYAFLAEGWVSLTDNGDHGFATNSDDASDVWVNNNLVADWYGVHGTAGQLQDHSRTINLDRGVYRYAYRFHQGYGGDGYEAGYDRPGGGANWGTLGASRCYYRKRADPQPAVSRYSTDVIGIRLIKEGSWLLGWSALTVGAGVNDQLIATLVTEAWHTVALTYDRANLILYVDGVEATRQAYAQAVTLNAVDAIIGDIIGDWYSQSGPADEVRISRVARTPDWLLLGARAMAGDLVTIGSVEQP